MSTSDVVIEIRNNKPTGHALVFLRDQHQVEEAISHLDRVVMGPRYLEMMRVRA